MEKLTILGLIGKYKKWLERGDIQFLKKGSEDHKEVLVLVDDLINLFKDATDKATRKETDLSDELNWHNAHEKGKKLWHKLASCSLKNIDSGSKGNSKLFEYLDAATSFEDLLYGLEQYYRDHTLHSLWVYFVGEHILRNLLPDVYNNLNWYLYNDIEKDTDPKVKKLRPEAKKIEKRLCDLANNNKDAIWCIMALCHDLGYSLEKLDMLNEKAREVLKFFDRPDFRNLGYSLDIEQQYIITQFLELMAMDVRIVPDQDSKQALIKCYRDDSTYWRLCKSLEKKQHGMISAYLIYKNLGIFADASVRVPSEQWGLDEQEAVDNMIRGNILFAMAQHTFDFAYIDGLSGYAELLIVADEIEEFSRYGRQMLSRDYHDTAAEAGLKIRPSQIKQGCDIELDICYKVAKEHPLGSFFKRKSEKICKLYTLEDDNDHQHNKFCKIKKIKMTTEQDNQKFYFVFQKGPTHKAYLPKTEIKGKSYKAGEYNLTCDDDKLIVNIDKEPKKLDEWIP